MTNQQFDVFLCHNSEDKPAVIQVAEQLRQFNLKPWLDIHELRPGTDWQWELEQQIEQIGAVAVFVGKAGVGPWQQQEIYAFLQESVKRKYPVIPVLLTDAPQQPKLPIFLKNRTWVDFRVQQPNPIGQLIWGITGDKPSAMFLIQHWVTSQPKSTPSSRPGLSLLSSSKVTRQKFLGWCLGGIVVTAGVGWFSQLLNQQNDVDYSRLENFLKAQQWRKADEETAFLMLKVAGREKEGRFDNESAKNFPCHVLSQIDQFWVRYSNGMFGFSVQKKIWQAVGSPTEYDSRWEMFGDSVGWRRSGRWLSYTDLAFDPKKSFQGELPVLVWWDGVRNLEWAFLLSCKNL